MVIGLFILATVRVHCRLLKEDRELLPGLFLKGIIETGIATTTTAVPDKAIVQSTGKSYIFIASEETKVEKKPADGKKDEAVEKHIPFKRIEVTTGVSENDHTEVILPEGFDRKSK